MSAQIRERQFLFFIFAILLRVAYNSGKQILQLLSCTVTKPAILVKFFLFSCRLCLFWLLPLPPHIPAMALFIRLYFTACIPVTQTGMRLYLSPSRHEWPFL